MKVFNLNGKHVEYPNNQIRTISFHRAADIYSAHDLLGNDVEPDEVLMRIDFKDETCATFTARNWRITDL